MSDYFNDLSFSSDYRVLNADLYRNSNFCLYRTNPDTGAEYEDQLPLHWVVCPTCGGRGTHVNPSIDAGGLTGDDLYDDPDFFEDYRSGLYDQVCSTCHGRTTVQDVDVSQLDDETRILWEKQRREEWEGIVSERRAMAMGY